VSSDHHFRFRVWPITTGTPPSRSSPNLNIHWSTKVSKKNNSILNGIDDAFNALITKFLLLSNQKKVAR
jgi:hypothetical protein